MLRRYRCKKDRVYSTSAWEGGDEILDEMGVEQRTQPTFEERRVESNRSVTLEWRAETSVNTRKGECHDQELESAERRGRSFHGHGNSSVLDGRASFGISD